MALLVARGSLSVAAAADLEPLRIELTAPAECPAEPSMFVRLRAHTSRVREAKPDEAARLLHVTVSPRDGGGVVAELRLVEDGDELQRRVPGRTCEEVLAAVALIAALAIDAHLEDAGTPARGEPRGDAGDAAPETTQHLDGGTRLHSWGNDRRERDASDDARPRSPSFAMSFGTSLEATGLGELVLGGALWAEGSLTSRLSPSLRLRLTHGDSFTVEKLGRPAVFRLSTAALDGCIAAIDTRAFQLRPCVQIAGGVLDGASSAFGPTERKALPWATAGGLLQGRWFFLGPLSLESSAGLTVALVRDDFFFRPQSTVYRAPPLLFIGSVGVGTTFR